MCGVLSNSSTAATRLPLREGESPLRLAPSYERWFMDMVSQPQFCEALLDRTLQFWLDWFRVFLDEVGELGLDEQSMLLRAIEERKGEPDQRSISRRCVSSRRRLT